MKRSRAQLVCSCIGLAVIVLAIGGYCERRAPEAIALRAMQPFPMRSYPMAVRMRWLDTTRATLVMTAATSELQVAEVQGHDNPGVLAEALKKPPTRPSAAFHLPTQTMQTPASEQWVQSNDILRDRNATLPMEPEYAGLKADRDSHYLPVGDAWRQAVSRRPLAGEPRLLRYHDNDFVAVVTATPPLIGRVNDFAERRGPFYLQVFSRDCRQIGPTLTFTGVARGQRTLYVAWLQDDPTLIITDDSEVGRWWMKDFKNYLDAETNK